MKKQPLYIKISEDLQKEIENGIFPAGKFLPSERQLSIRFDVERATLRHALELLVERNYIQKLPGAGAKVIYLSSGVNTQKEVQNAMVYIMPGGEKNQTVQPFHMELCDKLERYCKANGYNLFFTKLCPPDPIPEFMQPSSYAKGIIFVSDVDVRYLEAARLNGVPSIGISCDYPHFPQLHFDEAECAYTATKHLIDSGCRKIATITGEFGHRNMKFCLEGYRRALLSNGLNYDCSLIKHGDWNFNSGTECTQQLLDEGIGFDGIFCGNDMMALGAMRALYNEGISVPKIIKIIGINDIEQSRTATPALTTMAMDLRDMASMAFLLLKEIIAGNEVPRQVIIPARLIKRQTT